MGGPPTDVSHVAGSYDRTNETLVAGVRVRSPMLEIHTVAAGGGSVCHYDGSRFRVGPDSAGAVPGPACYRRGGPLTTTARNGGARSRGRAAARRAARPPSAAGTAVRGKASAEPFPAVCGPGGKCSALILPS